MPRKLTEAQIRRIRAVAALRKNIPTNAQLAVEIGCSERLVAHFAAGGDYKFPVEHASIVHEVFIELGLTNP